MQLLPKARQVSTKIRLAVIAALALSLAAMAAPAANAGYSIGSSYCWDSNTIVATEPGMTAETIPWTGSFVGGGQKVGFRVVLQKWAPPTSTYAGHWYDLVASNLLTRTVGNTVLADGEEPWYDAKTKTYKWSGNTNFTMNGATGYFRVRYHLYWYLNGVVSSSATNLPANGNWDHRDDKVYVQGWSNYEWCRY